MYNLIYNCSWATKERLQEKSHHKKKRCISDNQKNVSHMPRTTWGDPLQHNTTHCNRQQQKATKMKHTSHTTWEDPCIACTSLLLQCATNCNTLHHTSTHCNTLQRTAAHCNTLQTYCSSLQPASLWTRPWLVIMFFKWVCCLRRL